MKVEALMKNEEATGPGEISAEGKKSLAEEGVNVVWEVLKKI